MNRRTVLQAMVSGAAVARFGPARADAPLRITLPSQGSAGAVWQPLVERLRLTEEFGLNLDWIVADPGKMQTQLSAGALDIGVFGTVGLSTLVNKGSDIVLFGPALNNHGRWIVKAGSSYGAPRDLRGKTVAATAETSETWQQARIAAFLGGFDLKTDFSVIHGSPTANLALFERGDVEGIITLEPTATRLVGRGARQIARVADIWKQATGLPDDPFLVGLAASQRWLDANHATAAKVAALFARVNGEIRKDPSLLVDVAPDVGLKPEETRALSLLPTRAVDSYATRWDESVFAVIDKQIDVATHLGLLADAPKRKIYVKV